MENIIENLIKGNNRYQWKILQENEKIEPGRKSPHYPLLILTCMDPRIDVHRIFQLNIGDAFVLRNAGNQITEDVFRSILIAVYEYNVKFVVVLGHLDCGMRKLQLEEIRHKLLPIVLKQISQNSTNYHFALQKYFKPFVDEIKNISNQVNRLKMTKGMPPNIQITGMLFDPVTGWIFPENEFKSYLSYEDFMKNYQKILHQKRMNHIDFLETIEGEIVGPELVEFDEITEKPDTIDVSEEDGVLNKKAVVDEESEYIDMKEILEKNAEVIEKTMNIVSKVQVPKIHVPKIKVYIPKINKIKKNN
jgi:carbonic anhydrase